MKRKGKETTTINISNSMWHCRHIVQCTLDWTIDAKIKTNTKHLVYVLREFSD